MSSRRAVRTRLGRRARRMVAFMLALALIGGGALTAVDQAVAAPTCEYELCDIAFVNVNGSDYVTSMVSRTDTRPGMKNPVGADTATRNTLFSLEDRQDGGVWIHDRDGNCVYAGDDSGGLAYVRPCEHSPDEVWYFQNEDYANSFAIRKAYNADGAADDRCLDVRNGKTGAQSHLQVIPCKRTSSNWQKFSPVDPDPQRAATFRTAIQDRATRYASTQCEKAVIVSCSYWQKSADEPSLANAVPLLSPVHNYTQQATTQKVTVGVIKTATVTFGFSQKFAIKIEAGVAGFAKTEWTTEQIWSAGKAWTDTSSWSQEMTLPIPPNGYSWVAYAQLARKVTGQINFRVKDTGKTWQGQATAVMPSTNSGNKTSQILLCDNLSTQKVCTDSSPYSLATRSASSDAAETANADWLVSVEGDNHACSGSAVNDSWVLTSKHCAKAERVRYTTAEGQQADGVPVDRIVDSSTGDVRLLHLASATPLAAYPRLDLGYTPRTGDAAFGLTIGRPAAPEATRSPVTVSSTGTDALGGGELIVTRADTAPRLLEDSGGPLLVDGRLVGVAAVSNGSGRTPTVSYANLRTSSTSIAIAIGRGENLAVGVDGPLTAGASTNLHASVASASGPVSGIALSLKAGAGATLSADRGATDAGGLVRASVQPDAWTLPGTALDVSATAAGSGSAAARVSVAGANALGSGSGIWGGLGVRSPGWPVRVATPDQLQPVFSSPIVQSASNKTSVAVVLADGTVWVAGQNGYHELVGTDGPVEWTRVEGLENVTQIAMTEYSTAALLTDGTVMAWGSAGYGQLGGGNVGGDVWSSPRRVDELSNVVQVVASPASAYAVLADGTVRACGWNDAGQLGDGTTTDRSTYAPVQGATDVVSVATVGASATALRADGTVLFWGADENRRPVAPRAVPGLEHVRSLSGGVALRQDGTVSLIQAAGSRVVSVDGLSEVTAIAGTGASYWALRADGALMAWGRNDAGQLGVGSAVDVTEPTAVVGLPGLPVTGVFPSSVGNKAIFTVGAAAVDVAADRRIVAGAETAVSGHVRTSPGAARPSSVSLSSSTGALSTPSVVPDASGAFHASLTPGAWTRPGALVDVTATSGPASSVARSRVVGANALGVGAGTWGGLGSRAPGWPVRVTTPDQLQPVFASPIAQLASNGGSVIALLEDGTVWGTGQNGYHEISGDDGPVSSWRRIGEFSDIRQVAMTEFSAVALRADGTVLAWGTSGYGQLGSGATGGVVWSTPRKVDELSDIVQVAGGGGSVYALSSDGTVRAAGFNDAGQLGDGSRRDSSSFIPVRGLDAVASIAPYGRGVLALREDGTAWYWGQGRDGAPTPVAGLTGVTAVSGRVALLVDGSVRVVSDDGRTSALVDGLHDVVSVGGDGASFYAVLPDGSVKAWGSNDVGQLGDGTTTDRQAPVDVIGLQGQPVTAVFTSSHRNKAFFVTGDPGRR